jgi:UrcA family protein
MKRAQLSLAAGLLATVLGGGMAAAQPAQVLVEYQFPKSDKLRMVTIDYAYIAYEREAGARVLLSRIESAANVVCGGNDGRMSLDRWTYYQSCKQSAMDRAVAEIPSQAVHNMYSQLRPSLRQVAASQ